jgi:hypothetical protein
MTSLPDTIVLHLGAHKTASTHLQRSLAAAALSDVAVFGPPQLRGASTNIPARFGFPLDPKTADTSNRPVRDVLLEMADEASRLVLSDENFAGKLQTGWGKIPTPLYFTAAKRIDALTHAIRSVGGPGVHLCLAIRDPAGYLTSCYSQILHGGRVVTQQKYIDKNPLGIVDWVDYAQRLRSVPGIVSLTIWRYEDYRAVFPKICQAMVGTDQVEPITGRLQVRLSEAALQQVLLLKVLRDQNVVAAAAEAHPVSETNPAFRLYDAVQQAQSDALYAAQWDKLATLDGVSLIQPQ